MDIRGTLRRRRRLLIVGAAISIGVLATHLILEKKFFDAIADRNIPLVRRLLTVDPLLIRATDYLGSNALNSAVYGGNIELVQLFVSAGSDLNHDSLNGPPLHCAAYHGDANIVEILLDAGADANMESHAKPQTIEGTPLHEAAAGGSANAIRLLIALGASVNARDSRGNRTPLHFAVSPEPERANRMEAIAILLSNGADVNAKDLDGRTALDYVNALLKSDERSRMKQLLENKEDGNQFGK